MRAASPPADHDNTVRNPSGKDWLQYVVSHDLAAKDMHAVQSHPA